MQEDALRLQIIRIQQAISTGKAKNIFAAKNKIKSLKKQLERIKFHNFLAK